MRLTDTHRNAFVNAAMQDVPLVNYEEQIRALALSSSASYLPPKVRAIAQDSNLRHFLRTDHHYLTLDSGDGRLSNHIAVYVYVGRGDEYRPTPADRKKLDELSVAMTAQKSQRSNLRDMLVSVAKSCRTRQQLANALPEFEKYLPTDDAKPGNNVPAIANVVAEFSKAGWPKGKGGSA